MDILTKLLGASWKTTLLGIIAGLGLLLPQLGAVLDDDPETNLDPTQIAAGFGLMIGGKLVREEKVSSKDAGAG